MQTQRVIWCFQNPPQYSLFGKVVNGFEVADAMQKVATGPGDRPLEDVVMESVTVTEGD